MEAEQSKILIDCGGRVKSSTGWVYLINIGVNLISNCLIEEQITHSGPFSNFINFNFARSFRGKSEKERHLAKFLVCYGQPKTNV